MNFDHSDLTEGGGTLHQSEMASIVASFSLFHFYFDSKYDAVLFHFSVFSVILVLEITFVCLSGYMRFALSHCLTLRSFQLQDLENSWFLSSDRCPFQLLDYLISSFFSVAIR